MSPTRISAKAALAAAAAVAAPLAALCLALVSACGGDFAPYEKVTTLRMLALRAQPPWPLPGETATLDALAHAPASAGAISYAWSWCPVVGAARDGYPCLVGDPTQPTWLALLSAAGVDPTLLPSFDLGSNATASLTHQLNAAQLQSICQALTALLPPTDALDCTDAWPIQVRCIISTAQDSITTIKTVLWRFSEASRNNANPGLTSFAARRAGASDAPSVALDGSASALLQRDAPYELSAGFSPEAAEPFTDNSGSPQQERLLLTWFSEEGELDTARTLYIPGTTSLESANHNEYTPPTTAAFPAAQIGLWVVVRDNRGGVGWTAARATLEAAP